MFLLKKKPLNVSASCKVYSSRICLSRLRLEILYMHVDDNHTL